MTGVVSARRKGSLSGKSCELGYRGQILLPSPRGCTPVPPWRSIARQCYLTGLSLLFCLGPSSDMGGLLSWELCLSRATVGGFGPCVRSRPCTRDRSRGAPPGFPTEAKEAASRLKARRCTPCCSRSRAFYQTRGRCFDSHAYRACRLPIRGRPRSPLSTSVSASIGTVKGHF